MTPIPANDLLQDRIARAWQEIQHDPQHRLRVGTRLDLYDHLIGDLGVTIRDLAITQSFFPQVTPGLKRYWYLGLQTVRPLLPLWDSTMASWLAVNPDYDPDWSFPAVILEATNDLLQGIAYEEVDAMLPQKTPYCADMSAWHYAVGNMTEILPSTAMLCLEAIYAVHCAVIGIPPIGYPFSDNAYDDDIDPYSKRDFTAYTFAAAMSLTVTTPNVSENLPHPLHGGSQQPLDFWHWWLSELLPQAGNVNVDSLGWQITHMGFANKSSDETK